ncbi:MAG: hypothetical protein V4692_07345 [Bdellovibrionota bacterium]
MKLIRLLTIFSVLLVAPMAAHAFDTQKDGRKPEGAHVAATGLGGLCDCFVFGGTIDSTKKTYPYGDPVEDALSSSQKALEGKKK